MSRARLFMRGNLFFERERRWQRRTIKQRSRPSRLIRNASKCDVAGQEVDELASSVYIDKRVLDHLGNPESVVVTVAVS